MIDDEIKKRLIALLSKADKVHDELMNGYKKRLISLYKKSLDEIKKKIAAMYEKYGEKVTYSDMQSYNRLAVLEKEIALQLKELTGENIKLTTDSIKESFVESFYRTGYGFEKGLGVKMGFGQLNPAVINAAVLNPLDSIKWPERLKDHINQYNRAIRQEITQGLIEGKGYAKIAKGITEKTSIMATKAFVIARTESGRAQSAARTLAFDKSEAAAERLGVKTTRIWIATLDERTRDTHRSMDKQEAHKNANGKLVFTLPGGAETEGPRLSGIASEDINCRCTTSLIIEELTHKIRRDNINKSLFKDMSYDEWATEKGIRLRRNPNKN